VGCAVPQPRGDGNLSHVVEPTTKRGYWLYLPKAYVDADEATRKSRRWPLVVTFHGMKPFDNARPQAREWEQEADRYGYVVVAPELRAHHLLGEFPIRTVNEAFKSDEDATLAILDHVFATTDADPSNVLSTSWSSGGYTAHYMLNHYPDRFTCLAVRQSNFSATILDPAATQQSRYHPVFIINTENDFAICKRESLEARHWYEAHGYENKYWVTIKDKGHERTPDLAAEFFSRVTGVRPNRPPTVLVKRQAIEGNAEALALLAGKSASFRTPPRNAGRRELARRLETTNRSLSDQNAKSSATGPKPPSEAMLVRTLPNATSPDPDAGNKHAATPRENESIKRAPVSIYVSSAIALEPLHLVFRAICPTDWTRTANFLWTLDGDPLCSGVNGHLTLSDPKEYTLGLQVVTASGREYRAYRQLRVLPRVSAANHQESGADR